MEDSTTASDIAISPAGPHITRAASENGASECTSSCRGMIPMTAIVPRT
jgi:hypothetical protein